LPPVEAGGIELDLPALHAGLLVEREHLVHPVDEVD
jgi:hypothetical protein